MTLADHISELATGMTEPVQDTVRVRVVRDWNGRTADIFALTMHENGEPVNWPEELEALCDDRRPSFFNLIRAGFTIEPVGE